MIVKRWRVTNSACIPLNSCYYPPVGGIVQNRYYIITGKNVFMQKQVNHSVRRIHKIAERTGAVSYLEIGVCTGDTFLNVDLPFKVAVDPAFRFDTAEHESAVSCFFPMTSDLFFERIANDRGLFRAASNLGKNPETFDIIFLDGLHTFEQTARDFVNSQKYAHEKTVWIIDDTVPCDPISAVPSLNESCKIRNALGVEGGLWHGDVFKVVLWLHDIYPQFSYCTIMDEGNPQTIVWLAEHQERPKAFAGIKEIERTDYFSMLDYADCFAPVVEKDFMTYLGGQMTVLRSRITDKDMWKKLIYRKLVPPHKSWWKEALIRLAACCIPVKATRKRLRRKWLEA